MDEIGVELERHVVLDPGARDRGVGAAQLLERRRRELSPPGHARGCDQHAVGAAEIRAKPDGGLCRADRLLVFAADIVGERRRAVDRREERIARTQAQRALGGCGGFLPAPGKCECGGIIVLGMRKARIEVQRMLGRGQRVVETPHDQMNAAESVMRPGILATSP
jgi:hypothetical protein